MIELNTSLSMHSTAQANDLHNKQQQDDLIQQLRNPETPPSTFLEEATRLTLLARLGVDMETLERLEEEIEKLENIDERTDKQQQKLKSLLEQREALIKEAMERQNGKSLPTGSMISVTA